MSPIAAMYYSLYKKGLRTLEQIPEKYRAEVEAAIARDQA